MMRELGLILENLDGFDQPGVMPSVSHTLALGTTIIVAGSEKEQREEGGSERAGSRRAVFSICGFDWRGGRSQKGL